MARELKQIINNRLHLSADIKEETFEAQFANGYLFGEILYKFGLQPDFPFIQNSDAPEDKIRNYSRIFPAMDDIGFRPSIAGVHKIMQAQKGVAVSFVYQLFKALKILPMRNPRWNVEKAEKFKRKGSWAEFVALLNVDYETYKSLDEKYHIPGEERCQHFEKLLRAEVAVGQIPTDAPADPPRSYPAKSLYKSEWEVAVQSELDKFDEKHAQPAERPISPLFPIDVHALPSNEPTLPPASPKSALSKSKSPIPRTTASTENLHEPSAGRSASPAPASIDVKPHVSFPLDPVFAKPQEIVIEPLPVEPQPFMPEKLADIPEIREPRKAKSKAFDKQDYMKDIHKKADERKQQKLDAERKRQSAWLDELIDKRKIREHETQMALIHKINERVFHDRQIALKYLLARREAFDQKVIEEQARRKLADERQKEYVKTMLNQGFWELLGKEALNAEELSQWCTRAGIPFVPEAYDRLCKNYSYCKDVLLRNYDETFADMFRTVCVEEGDNSFAALFTRKPALSIDVPPPESEIKESSADSEEKVEETESFFVSEPSTIMVNNSEFQEYIRIVTEFSYETLGWMTAFISPKATEKRRFGHIVSTILNSAEWKLLPSAEPKYPKTFVSIWVSGKRTSELKKAILTKLAMTYNLEIISVADLVHDAVEIALSMQPEIPEIKEKTASKRRLSKTAPQKKISLPKVVRGKSKSIAPTASAIGFTGMASPMLHSDEFSKRILRSMVEDATLDPGIIAELVELAIETRVIHPLPRVDLTQDAASVATSTSTKKGRSESRAKAEADAAKEKPPEDLHPFGWVLTDLPLSPETVAILEQRLGGATASPRPATWETSVLAQDEFGPKPYIFPPSFFGAVLNIDYPDEHDLLHSARHSDALDTHSEDEKSTASESTRSHAASKAKSRQNFSPTPNLVSLPEDGEAEIFHPNDVKRGLAKFMVSLESHDDTGWSAVESFYSSYSVPVLTKVQNWKDPLEGFGLVTEAVEHVMKMNRGKACCGVSPEVHQKLEETIMKVCKYVWDYRTAVRMEIAEKTVGFQFAPALFHYLFKQDIVLVRDVYCKCQSRLYRLARERGPEKRNFVIALYRKTSLPLEKATDKRLTAQRTQNGPYEEAEALATFHTGDRVYCQPVVRPNPSTLNDIETELLRIHNEETPNSNDEDAESSKQLILKDVLQTAAKTYADQITQLHRQNALVLIIRDITPTGNLPAVFDFPYFGPDIAPNLEQIWRDIESNHIAAVTSLVQGISTAEAFSAHNTKKVKELFKTCINTPNKTAGELISKYVANYETMRSEYPEANPVDYWKRKALDLYRKLSNLADYRCTGMYSCLRNLMQKSGFSEVVLRFRNAYFAIIQNELEHFLSVLRFLWKARLAALSLPDEDFSGNFGGSLTLPLYKTVENPLFEAQGSLESYNLENPVPLDPSMLSNLEQDLEVFLEITSDDDEIWRKVLETVRFHLDQCAKQFLRKRKSSQQGFPKDQEETMVENDGFLDIRVNMEKPAVGNEEFAKSFPVITIEKLVETSPTEADRASWFETFEKFDFEEMLSTVRADVLRRKKLKEDAQKSPDMELNIPGGERLSGLENTGTNPELELENTMILRKKVERVIKDTVDQEVNVCMLKICRIIVDCVRKCNGTRSVAKETFTILDRGVYDVHEREQRLADTFFESAMNVLYPKKSEKSDEKRWDNLRANSSK